MPATVAAVVGALLLPIEAHAGDFGTHFTYQGRLMQNGEPVNGIVDLTFELRDAPVDGNFLGTVEFIDFPVVDGLVTVSLDYGPNVFDGRPLWLEIEVNKNVLSPRQELSATPYALQTRGILVDAQETIRVVRPTGDAVLQLETGEKIFRIATIKQEYEGDFILQLPQLGAFRILHNNGDPAMGLFEDGTWRINTEDPGNANVHIHNDNNTLKVSSVNGVALVAETMHPTQDIIRAQSADGLEFRVSKDEAFFAGSLTIVGQLSKGSGSFRIDHPLDPENKYLSHSFVESPDMMNVYNGNVLLDQKGESIVELPAYFGALNRDFRYQLTCIGGHAPVYIAQEIVGNRFKIAGGTPGLKVSWQVTGIRQDRYAQQNRIVVEENKPTKFVGSYLHPAVFGQPKSMSQSSRNAIRDSHRTR